MNWIIWALLSGLFGGLTMVLVKAGVAGIDSNLAVAVRTVVVLLFAWAIAGRAVASGGLSAFSHRTWIFLVLSGLATGVSWLCYFRALQLGEVARVAVFDRLGLLFFAAAFGLLFLGERLSWKDWTGLALVAAGSLLMAWKFK